MNDEQDPKTMNPFDEADGRDPDDVLSSLRVLGEAIDRQRYPGRAWRPGARRRARPVVIWLAVATAAAAAVLLAVVWFWPATPPGDPPGPSTPIAKDDSPAASPMEEEGPLVWAVPSDVDPSLAGGLDFTVPSVSILPASDGDGIEWTIPSVSFPEFQERNTNDDEKEDVDDVGGGGADRGFDGDVDDGPSAKPQPAARRPAGGETSAV